jgi:hypothetical protein
MPPSAGRGYAAGACRALHGSRLCTYLEQAPMMEFTCPAVKLRQLGRAGSAAAPDEALTAA